MIQSQKDLRSYIRQDRIMNSCPGRYPILLRIKDRLIANHTIRFLKLLRKAEYYTNCRKYSILKFWYVIRYRRLGMKLGFSIPLNAFGPGLSLPHTGTIVVHPNARIGANCRLHVCTNIGASAGGSEAPKLGNNIYIGPGAILFGDITLADDITIGANATVNRSCDKTNVVLAGTPAKVVKEEYPNWVVFNKLIN